MIYEIIKTLRPYFYSLREIEDNVSLDMKFPIKWKTEYQDDSVNVIVQDKNEKVNLVSFITPATKEGYETVINIVQAIIKFNLDEEEKEKLFQQKINELKELFANESLDKLKEITFKENGHTKDNTRS